MKTKTEIQEITAIRRQQIREEFYERLDSAIASAAYNGLQEVELEMPQCWERFCNHLYIRYSELGFSVECSKKTNLNGDDSYVKVSWED